MQNGRFKKCLVTVYPTTDFKLYYIEVEVFYIIIINIIILISVIINVVTVYSLYLLDASFRKNPLNSFKLFPIKGAICTICHVLNLYK